MYDLKAPLAGVFYDNIGGCLRQTMFVYLHLTTYYMKHISILVPVGNIIIDTIIGPYNLLRMANAHYKRIHELSEDLFKIDLVGLSAESVQYQGLFQVTPTKTITEVDKTNLIIFSAKTRQGKVDLWLAIEKLLDNNF